MPNYFGTNEVYQGINPSGNKKVKGWNSRSPIFGKLIEYVKPNVIIEVGSWLGASAIQMATQCKKLSLKTKIYCVDTWLGAEEFWTTGKDHSARDLKLKNGYPQVYTEFLSNIVEFGFQDVIVPIPNTSYIGSIIFKYYKIKADLIYIDASHEYEDVKSDIKSYLKLLNPNGVIFGDDMTWPSVRKAVNEVLPNEYDLYDNNFWIYVKPSITKYTFV